MSLVVILPLRVETGRYVNENINQRICTFCQQNEVENEIHFSFKCDLYKKERQEFVNSLNYNNFNNLSDVHKLRYCFEHKVRLFAKFVKCCYLKRRDTLYNSK